MTLWILMVPIHTYYHEDASNLNKTELFWIFAQFESFKFQTSPTQDKFFEFLQKYFFHWEFFKTNLFQWMGVQALFCSRKCGRTCSHSIGNTISKHISQTNRFCKKSRNLSWVGVIWSSKSIFVFECGLDGVASPFTEKIHFETIFHHKKGFAKRQPALKFNMSQPIYFNTSVQIYSRSCNKKA